MKRIVTSLLVAVGMLTVVAVANRNISAQSTCDSSELADIRECIEDGVATCAAATTDCNARRAGLSLNDVREYALEDCCDRSTKKRRRSCLNAEVRSYETRTERSPQGTFFRAARNTVKELIRNDCFSGSYAQLF